MSQNCGDDRGEESGPCLRSLQPSERQRRVHEPLCWKMSNNPNEEILRECHKVPRAVASTEVMKAGGLHVKKAAQKFSEMATKCRQPTACVSGPVQVGPLAWLCLSLRPSMPASIRVLDGRTCFTPPAGKACVRPIKETCAAVGFIFRVCSRPGNPIALYHTQIAFPPRSQSDLTLRGQLCSKDTSH